ncbi:sensor histidine kinase [Actinacidiphila glaucinigra]|uniref:sensor histidine kinase n=1 Tax=Actinacidiphila glaucinigra TaxID=235986 RepID=UPI0035D928E1
MKLRWPPPVVMDAILVAASMFDVFVNVHVDESAPLAWALTAAVALMLRRHWPLLTFLLTLPSALVSSAIFASLTALYTLATVTRRRALLVLCGVAFTLCYVPPWPGPQIDLTEPATYVSLAYTVTTAAAPLFLGQLVQARHDLSTRLREISEARDHERLLTDQTVLAKERAQLAREMHDVVSHQVSLIAVQAGALQVDAPNEIVKQTAERIRRLSVQTLDELRHMVDVLRAAGSRRTELTPQPSLHDLQRLVASSAIRADLDANLPDDLPPTIQRAVYRTVQEALTNVRKHAPGAAASVRIRRAADLVQVTVTNGPPTRKTVPLPSARYGLIGLRERAALLNGSFRWGPTTEGGYQVHLELPIDGTP